MDHPAPSGVRIRMYRQGLGDCFLISIPRATGDPLQILIDCGVLLGTQNAAAVMTEVARDIAAVTGGHLDVVVATHEHWDHLSGFVQARDVFDQMRIDELWLGWTEDPGDSLAAQLRSQREQALRGLRALACQLSGLNAAAAESLRGTLAFFGAASGPSTRDALDYLVDHPSRPRVRYHRPGGAPLALPGAGDAQVYVLGPPRDEALLRRSNPTKSGHEVYEFGPALALVSAAGFSSFEETERGQAFEPHHRIPARRAEQLPFFRSRYFQGDGWRKIEAEWFGAAEELALALDNHTNNTSLALAFELEPGGRVLLFPGDAQVGNWLSWDDCQWPPATPSISAADLLRRTVLYKVGHHGSHNATLRDKGLERMTSPDLVALVPVDRGMAERKHWNMPFPALFDRLHELARGRILRSDDGIPDRPDLISPGEWRKFTERIAVGPNHLYTEYTL